jgi:hypothetical protein
MRVYVFRLHESGQRSVDTNNIGSVMRIPCSTALLRVVSLMPGTNADSCEEPLSAARVKAVLNAAPIARRA